MQIVNDDDVVDDDMKVVEALEPHVNVETLKIDGFRGAELPVWMAKLENLTEIEIRNCPHCSHIPQLGDLPRLRCLTLGGLDALEFIVEKDENVSFSSSRVLILLEFIVEKDENVSFSSLRVLILDDLRNLKGLSNKEWGERMFPDLEKLDISGHELLILPQLSLSNLKELRLERLNLSTLYSFLNCKFVSLTSLSMVFDENDNSTTRCNIPEDALEGFYSLKELSIENGGQQCFPKKWFQGLKSLTTLDLFKCQLSGCFPEGWLRHLTALEKLQIYLCIELETSLEDIRYLHVLKNLTLSYLEEMVSLPQGLQHIHTLQSLSLIGPLPLTSLPDWLGNLSSLTHLYIMSCTDIRSLPSTLKGMTSLSYLHIGGCPLLERRCEKETGEDWHIIAHIPNLYIWS